MSDARTYRVVGSRKIVVASGEHLPLATGVALTADEAQRLLAMGAVELEQAPGAPAAGGAAGTDTEER